MGGWKKIDELIPFSLLIKMTPRERVHKIMLLHLL